MISRRTWLQRNGYLGLAALGLDTFAEPFASSILANGLTAKKIPVAAVVTEYRTNSHADVLVGKILEGWKQDGGLGPDLELVSLYTDQVPDADLSRALAAKYGFRICKTIDEALTLGSDRLQVGGVLSIGEHGDYPDTPDTKQKMYPRRRFFDEIVAAMDRCQTYVPIFNDKGLGYRFEDAKHMVDVARAKKIPFMAGSSLPVADRTPADLIPINCEIEAALTIGYAGTEIYGFHALETHQCQIERRKQGETGTTHVQAAKGNRILEVAGEGYWNRELMNSALAAFPKPPKLLETNEFDDSALFFLIDSRDGLRSSVAMLQGIGDEFVTAIKIRGEDKPRVNWFQLEAQKPFSHFANLLRAIEKMIITGKATYPVERTLMSTGILDRIMHSVVDNYCKYETPELQFSYSLI